MLRPERNYQSHSRAPAGRMTEAETPKVVFINKVASGTDAAAMTAAEVCVALVKSPWASQDWSEVSPGCLQMTPSFAEQLLSTQSWHNQENRSA